MTVKLAQLENKCNCNYESNPMMSNTAYPTL